MTGPKRREEVESADIDGQLVLWDPITRQIHLLDPVGSLFWPFLDGTATVTELAADAAEVWEVGAAEALESVAALVDQLQGARLLEDSGAPERAETPVEPGYLADPPSP